MRRLPDRQPGCDVRRLVLGNVAIILQAIGIYVIIACTVRFDPLQK